VGPSWAVAPEREKNIHTVKKSTDALVVAGKEIGLEVNAEKTKYMVMSRVRDAGQNHNIKT
jgi:hypothetical protein